MENKFDMMICLRMGKISKVKTPLDEFKVITPENPLLSKQVVTSKGNPSTLYQPTVNPYLNTQLNL